MPIYAIIEEKETFDRQDLETTLWDHQGLLLSRIQTVQQQCRPLRVLTESNHLCTWTEG